MAQTYTKEELNNCSKEDLITMVLTMQGQVELLNQNIEKLIEQIRIANSYRFGKHTEKLSVIDGQMSFFDEPEAIFVKNAPEPNAEEVLTVVKKKAKKKGQREINLKQFKQEDIHHVVTDEEADKHFGKGAWRRFPSETYLRLRYEPAAWTAEVHTVDVVVGTDGDCQDEFLRGKRPKELIKNSIVTPSLLAAILNAKYVNSIPLNRLEQEFSRDEVPISRQTMSNWIMSTSEKYFKPFVECMKKELLKLPVTQSDETPTQVIKESDHPNSKCYMWVHRSGELYSDRPIVIYEYQKGRDHHIPLEFYKDYKGVLVTDGLAQYHLVEKKLPNVINANCWAHARRDFSDAIKAMEKSNPEAVKQSIAHQALEKIGKFYKLDTELKSLTSEKRLQRRKEEIAPLVEEFFAWIKDQLKSRYVLPKSKTADGLNYCINQEKYLKVFLTDGDIPIDNSASERAIRTFCIGKKNWMFHNTARGAEASATVYSISETAKLNNLRPYYYFKYILEELAKQPRDEKGNIDSAVDLSYIMPWSDSLPDECRKPCH